MKKVFKLKDLDCANCAAKIENNLAKIPGINNVTVNFMTQKIVCDINAEDYNKVVTEMKKVVKKVDSDCELLV